MKKIQFRIAMAMLVLATSSISCEKVINVDLNDSNPQMVIEAHLYEGIQDFYVRVSKTTNYFTTQGIEPVDGAVVKLAVNSAESYTLLPDSSGVYLLPAFEATSNSTYTLTVEADGVQYVATAFMPISAPAGFISYVQDENNYTEVKYSLFYEFTDRAGEQNQYRFVISQNNIQQAGSEDIFLGTDENSDGEYIKIRFRRIFFDAGDTVAIQMRSIDEHVHLYYRTLKDIVGGSTQNNSAPSNPTSNFSNGALGCFDVYSKSEATLILPQ